MQEKYVNIYMSRGVFKLVNKEAKTILKIIFSISRLQNMVKNICPYKQKVLFIGVKNYISLWRPSSYGFKISTENFDGNTV
jgi:hypothetical protein